MTSTKLYKPFIHKTVMVIDDCHLNSLILKHMIKTYTSLVATFEEDSLRALANYTNYPNIYDVIIMDIQLPIMNGHELKNLIRNINPNQVIIAHSATIEHTDYFIENGFNDFLPKPFVTEDLLKILHKFLN